MEYLLKKLWKDLWLKQDLIFLIKLDYKGEKVMFDFEKWKGTPVAVHCETIDDAIRFCKELSKHGYKWAAGESCDVYSFWSTYREKICYVINDDGENQVYFRGMYSVPEGIKILEYSGAEVSGYEEAVCGMLDHCREVLTAKHRENATDDDFHNFNVAAELQNVTPLQALIGMMDKHVVSVHDMVAEHAEGREITLELWEKKICDNINYLLILWAMVNQEADG